MADEVCKRLRLSGRSHRKAKRRLAGLGVDENSRERSYVVAMTLPLRWPIICSALVALAQVYAAPMWELPVVSSASRAMKAGERDYGLYVETNSTGPSFATPSLRRDSTQYPASVAAPHCEHFTVHMERSYLVWCPPRSRRY